MRMTAAMRAKNILTHIFLLVSFALCSFSPSAAEIEKKEITVRRGGRDYSCLLMRSQVNPSQWFCMLTNPVLAEYREDKISHPNLWYYRFQRPDPRNPNRMQDFGVLRCGFALFPPPDVIRSLLSRLPRSGRGPTTIRMLPADELEIRIKPPGRKPVIGVASVSRGIGGFSDNEVTDFLVTLEKNDADLADRLLLDKTGLEFELSARLAPRGDLSWRDRIAATASPAATIATRDDTKHEYAGPSTSTGTGKRDWRRAGPGRQKIIDKTGSSAMGSTSKTSTGKGQRALQESRLLERERTAQWAACKGFFTLIPYPEAVRKEHMILEDAQIDWDCTYFALPLIQMPESIDIERIVMQISLLRGKDEYSRQIAVWKPDTKWRDEDKLPKTMLRFSLKDLMAGPGKPLEDGYFRVVTTVDLGDGNTLESVEVTPIVTGDIPIANPLAIADLLTLDVHLLDWTAPTSDPNRLTKVDVNLRQERRTLSKTLQVEKRNGEQVIPETLVWLVKAGSLDTPGAVEANVFFRTASGRRIPWSLNGQPREQDFTGGVWYFTDEDWKPATDVR